MVQSIDLVDNVAPQVQLRQAVQPLQVVNCLNQVVRKVEHSEVTKVADVLNLADLV